MPMLRFLTLAVLATCFCLSSCDNVGRAFDPGIGTPPPGTVDSRIQVVPEGGDARRGVPQVRAVFPQGGGWPTAVPIVVEFSESVNQASIGPSGPTGGDAKIVVRAKGTTQALPAGYDFLAGGRLLVIRPTTLTNEQNPTYEIVMLPGGRDADGVSFVVGENGDVLAEFQVNQDPSIKNGRILTTFPRNNQRDGLREAPYLIVFDRPPLLSSVTGANCFLRPQGGSAIVVQPAVAIQSAGVAADPRILQIVPPARLAPVTFHELVVNDTILFAEGGQLDFGRRTPFANFRTVGVPRPVSVTVGNALPDFPAKINRANFAALTLQVETPADALVGDQVVARIYGGDAATAPLGDLAFFERTANLPLAGAQSINVSFAGALGSLTRPRLDEGVVTYTVQLRRGNEHSGYVHGRANEQGLLDVTPPRVLTVGPPAAVSGNDVFTDQESLAFYGVASERIEQAELVDGVSAPVALFASAADGRFVMRPLTLGRLQAPRGYSLLLTDRSGNLSEAAITGNIVQRGTITGAFSGSVVVEAFDRATLLPVANATVLVDVDTPTVPASAQVVGITDAQGRVSFTGLGGATRTVTIVRAGYHLATLYQTTAAFVSLPLRPIQNATASFGGSVVFQPTAGATALVGNNTFDDPQLLGVASTAAEANVIPTTAIVPNRPQVITGFGGVFEPTALPGFAVQGYQMLGAALTTPTPPAAPAAPGAVSTQNLGLVPAPPVSLLQINGNAPKDFALATGLDLNNLVGGRPIVRVMASLVGFGGQVLAGVGQATAAGGSAWNVQANYGIALQTGFASYSPFLWLCTEARDTAGRISRQRGLFLFGVLVDPTQPLAIATITPPGVPSVGSPAVTYADTLNPAAVPGGLAMVDVVARDAGGRLWQLWTTDNDAAGGSKTVQFPDLATANVLGLAAGNWTVRTEARLVYPVTGMTSGDLLLAERLRQEVNYARSAAVGFTVQ
jgi:hypothetical protein